MFTGPATAAPVREKSRTMLSPLIVRSSATGMGASTLPSLSRKSSAAYSPSGREAMFARMSRAARAVSSPKAAAVTPAPNSSITSPSRRAPRSRALSWA